MNGYEAARCVKRSPGGGRLLIVAETSHARSGDRENPMDAGFPGCTEKLAATGPFVSPIAQFLAGKSGTP
jgi:CheY-like chemotaxis protein